MGIENLIDWCRITPDGVNSSQAIIFGHGARSSERPIFGSGKVLNRPSGADVKFYCPPDRVLTNMMPVDINNRIAYYTAKYRKIHEYVITDSGLSPESLQEDANKTQSDIYTPTKGKNDISLRALFESAAFPANKYTTIHCVFCRVGLVKREQAREDPAFKEKLKYTAKAR